MSCLPDSLPPLKSDLMLKRMSDDINGHPAWHLYDPVKHQYHALSWQAYEIIHHWDQGTAEGIVESVNRETTLQIDSADVEAVYALLVQHQLLSISPVSAASYYEGLAEMDKQRRLKQKAMQFLFYRIKLCNPDQFLSRTVGVVAKLFHQRVAMIFGILAILAIVLLAKAWEQYVGSFSYFYNLHGMMLYAVAAVAIKVIHELAHAYTAKYYGCRVTNMGVAFLVFWPVAYTDVTDAWKLESRQSRVAIDAAGIIAEIAVAVLATLLWVITPDGALRSVFFVLSSISWILSLLINANPCLKFDGYYALSDALNIHNLQNTAFKIGRAALRKCLFGIQDPLLTQTPARRRRGLVFYAFITWVFRVILSLSIAVIIYTLLFKVLAIVLISIQLALTLVLPIVQEIRAWMSLRDKMRWNRRTIRSSLLLVMLVFILVYPWQQSITVPALAKYAESETVYTPESGVVRHVYIHEGDYIQKGQPLFSFESAEIAHKLHEVEHDIRMIKLRLSSESFRSMELGFQQVSLEDLKAKLSEQDYLKAKSATLKVTASIAGKVTLLSPKLMPGVTLSRDEAVVEIVNPKSAIRIIGYLPERSLKSVDVSDAKAYFETNSTPQKRLRMDDIHIDQTPTRLLHESYLVSAFGGDIAAHSVQGGSNGGSAYSGQRWKVKDAVYRMTGNSMDAIKLGKIETGYVTLSVRGESVLMRCYHLLYLFVVKYL